MINEEDFNLLKEVNLDLWNEAERLKFRRKLSLLSRFIAIFLVLGICFYGWNFYSLNQKLDNKLIEYGDDAYCYMCGVKAYKTCSCIIMPPMSTFNNEFFETLGSVSANLDCAAEASIVNKNRKKRILLNFTNQSEIVLS